MEVFGLFGSAAPRMQQSAQQLTGRRRRRVTAQDALLFGDPAPAPASNTPPQGMIGAGAPVDRKKIVPMAGEPSGYTPGKRDWMKEIGSDPLGFFLTGTDGLSQKREEGIMSDYARQSAEQSAAQRQSRVEQAGALGMKGREAALFIDAPEDYFKNYAENMKPTTLSKGQRLVNGAGTDIFNADTGVSEGQAWQTDNTGKTLWGERQAATPEETNARAVTAETIRNNNMVNSLGRDRLAMDSEKATAKPTPMQTAVDKNWADDLVNWQINGSANFGKQMVQLEGAVKRLKGGEELSGPGTTFLPGITRDWFGQAGKDVQQQIQETMQSSLKEVLGGQFAQKEGEGILARVFDPTLEEGVNAQRAERLMTQLKLAADQKNKALEYYNQNGTMNGYQGKVPSEADFVAAMNFAPANVVVAPNGKQFPKEQATALRNFVSSLPANMQDPQFIARLDAALSPPSAAPGQQANAPPAGVSREEWNAMTPEEKALFQ